MLKKKFAIILYNTTIIISLLCYGSIFISPQSFWLAAVFSSFIPVILVINGFLVLIALLFHRRVDYIPMIFLIVGYPFLNTTYQFKRSTPDNKNSISVLSFNAKFFRKKENYGEFAVEGIRWAANDTSAIKCFQEYSTSNRWEQLDVTKRVSEKGYDHFIFQSTMADTTHGRGMAIFSKYPIINRGIVWFQDNSFNNGIYADIRVNEDTLRIFNLHLASLQLYSHSWSVNSLFNDFKQLISAYKQCTVDRTLQINQLIEQLKICPYPYIICGDFNDMPYNYNYYRLKLYAGNSFENAGEGFGFSYNCSPFFLRIDHQFYSKELKAINFFVDKRMGISDHFPTRGYYKLEKSR